MSYLLNLVYLLLLVAVGPWLLVIDLRTRKYRQGFAARLFGRAPVRRGNRPCVWLHAVSVGEVNLLATLIDTIERRCPECECVISTTNQTGFVLAKRKYAGRVVFHCPLDFSWSVRSVLRRLRPDLLILAELELWPNLIRAAKRHGVKVAVINGRLSDKSYRGYRHIRPLVTHMLKPLDLVAVQNERYARRFVQLGARPDSVHVTGSLKFDGAETHRDNPKTRWLAALAGIARGDAVFLAGSTQDPEESLALATYRQLRERHPRLRLILVPRHPERFSSVADMLDGSGIPWQRRSRLELDGADPAVRVLLVDAVGELGAWWGTAQVAFVGGSMGKRGGQNMIEPAAYGAVVSFGPNTGNFRDIVEAMLAAGAAVVVRDGAAITALVRRALEDLDFTAQMGGAARKLVSEQAGATLRTVELLDPLLLEPASAGGRRRRRDPRHSGPARTRQADSAAKRI